MSYELKTIGGFRLLYVMAAEAEYGEHLRARISPLMTGVGPVEAAAAVGHALAELKAEGALPDLIVCLGSAGSPTLDHARVYRVSHVSYRDMDASPLGFEKGATPFLDLPVTIDLPLRLAGIGEARLSTGANIVTGVTYATIDADMVEMETFAILRACQAFAVPLIGLRGISDGKAELRHVGDWTEYLHVIDEKLAAAVDRLEQAVKSGALPL